jgi:hypothetical protein
MIELMAPFRIEVEFIKDTSGEHGSILHVKPDARRSTLVSRRDVHKIVKIDLAPPDIMEVEGGNHNLLLPFLVLQ